MSKNIIISIIIPCFNGEKYIKGCLDSILKSKFSNYEVIVVDDVSTDNSRKILKEYQKFKKIQLFFLKKKTGPAKAKNLAVKNSSGKYLLFLDMDTEIARDSLTEIVTKFKQDKQMGALQAKLMDGKSQKIETVGHFLSIVGFPYEIGTGEKEKKYHQEQLIFGARNAAMAIRRDLFWKIGAYEEDYFTYGEETDLSWRVWLAGYKICYLPSAKVYHFQKSSLTKETKYRLFYEGAKNNTHYLLKNAPLNLVIPMLPLHILAWIFLSVKLIFQRRLFLAVWIYRGLWWNLKNIRKTLRKRKRVSSLTSKNNQVMKIIFGPLKIRQLFLKGLKWFSQI